ncbi:MAG: DUF6206 family protein [bacterium]
MKFNLDKELLERFENGLDPEHPDRSLIPAIVLGYGEISTVFGLKYEGQEDVVYKRMPIFDTMHQVEHYIEIYNEYNRLLLDIGVEVPEYDSISIVTAHGDIVFFVVQKRLIPKSFGNKVIHVASEKDIFQLFLNILRQLKRIWDFNNSNSVIKMGIDGQISNWAIKDFNPERLEINEETKLLYIDTSTPLIRKNGKEMLEAELFLKSTPSFLRWLVKWLFLQEVLDRYYDFRLVIVDLIANFYKEGREDLIQHLIGHANEFLNNEAKVYSVKPIEYKEVHDYYKNDAFIWSMFQRLRRIDRFLKTRIFRTRYPYILPGQIKR